MFSFKCITQNELVVNNIRQIFCIFHNPIVVWLVRLIRLNDGEMNFYRFWNSLHLSLVSFIACLRKWTWKELLLKKKVFGERFCNHLTNLIIIHSGSRVKVLPRNTAKKNENRIKINLATIIFIFHDFENCLWSDLGRTNSELCTAR